MLDSKNAPSYKEVIQDANEALKELEGHTFDVLSINKPTDIEYAQFLSKTISKLSSITGNMIELRTADHLNKNGKYAAYGKWIRQDPGFPDNIFQSDYLEKVPGIEVKAWFPFATEITARFKGSYQHCGDDNTYVALIAWLPEFILHGRPKIIDVWFGPASEVAKCRDNHYYNPPHYLVVEPQETGERTANLQQSNVEGYVFQADKAQQKEQLKEAAKEVETWEESLKSCYFPSTEVVSKVNELRSKYPYRLDTNFAKIGRIEHEGINTFEKRVYSTIFHGKPISHWRKISKNNETILEYINLWREEVPLPK
ncbi:TPA: hypothetical protein ACGW68_006009 [Bacillus cereus]|uniref:hypothetical protein n=1 Tax=Bacillus cereus TaxID=1396 RepID=UPI000BFA5112|nr:hypothetical protein [Bacillus cereus]PFJ22906.1 hypothetical protein COI91_04255 [Bacillus cereus]